MSAFLLALIEFLVVGRSVLRVFNCQIEFDYVPIMMNFVIILLFPFKGCLWVELNFDG